ncbi:MAG: CotH kinase family protein [Verrucomicrobiales bacterium]|nr:CotH kinase family protein [Verrucomicrobiales bacterium]
MADRPQTGGTGRFVTLAALAFAVGSVAWSAWSIREWIREHRESEASGPMAGRPRRAEPPDGPMPVPTRALAALASPTSLDGITNASRLYSTTGLWTVHLRFSPDQWAAMEPRPIEPLEGQRGPGGRFELRNPAASRNGLAGVRGLEFEWVHATVDFEGTTFSNAAVRFKGNGTYLRSRDSLKRPLKVDLNKYVPGVSLAGRTTLNLANLVADDSCVHDAMGYEFYRAAGVPAPRTAYARVFLSPGPGAPQYLGLYALIENLDEAFARERMGPDEGIFFKPVTTELFKDLGDDWAAYDRIYDPKRRPKPGETARVIELARLVSHAEDATFSSRIGDFIEMDEFARFLAATVLLSSYDGFLNNGQNYYLWLNSRTGRFQFLPWDLDNAWGRFGMVGGAQDRARASVRHPWMGQHRFLERMMAVPEFESLYRKVMTEMLESLFVPEVLTARVDAFAGLLRPVLAEESPRRAARFEQAITATRWMEPADSGPGFGRNRTPHPLKWFIVERERSVRAQLAGEDEGVRLERWR